MRGAWLPTRAGVMCARAVTGLAVLLAVCWAASAQAQVSVTTFNALKSYTAVVAQRMLDLEKRAAAQDALITEQRQTIDTLVAAHNAQRLWVVDFVCKWNRLLAQASSATELPPVPGPIVEGQDCAGTGPAPEWPAAIARP
jgi:uncharacterized coiled-coil protein SlyX